MRDEDKSREELIAELRELRERLTGARRFPTNPQPAGSRSADGTRPQNEALFSNLAEFIPGISIQGYRPDGVVCYWNKHSEDVFGYTAQEAIGKNLLELIVPEESRPVFLQCLKTGRCIRESGEFMSSGELVLRHKNGRTIPIYCMHTAVCMDGQEPLLFSIAIDISDRKQIEEELLNAKKLEAIGLLAGGIAHDFNNLLFVILGNISMAQMKLNDRATASRHLDEAEKACLRAKDLTHKFITFSSGGGPLKSSASIRDLIDNAVSLVLSGSNIRGDTRIPDNLWFAEMDESQMRQTLTGVLSNAREAMPRGGVIRVRAENLEVGAREKTSLLLEKEGRYVRMVISDEGTGIPAEHLGKIFDPYFSTKYRGSQKGMGFGLAIARSVIRKHNGNIQVESEPGKGTQVTILLPASPANTESVPARIGVMRRGGRKRVLIMDDEEMLSDLAKTMLEHLGYDVSVAADGNEAVGMYSEAMEEGREYDVVILDLTVKGGMGGQEAVQKLLYLNPGVKAIVSSGYSNDPIMCDFTKYGFQDILSKPYDLDKLEAVLDRVLVN